MVDVIEACPVCDARKPPVRFEVARDIDGHETTILLCTTCSALLNSRAYQLLRDGHDVESVQHTDFYHDDQTTLEQESTNLAAVEPILNYLYGKVDRRWEALTFCDFGAGRGYASISAAERFKHSFACEFDTRNVEQVRKVLGSPSNHHVVKNLRDIPVTIDVMFAWHVLEHIPRPLHFLRESINKFSSGSVFFIQCPGYRPEAIADCHYVFFNEPSMRSMFEAVGVKEIEIGFDTANGFIGYLGVLQ